jgi:hypothetical protein
MNMATKTEPEIKWVRLGQNVDSHAPDYNRVNIWRRTKRGKTGYLFAEMRTFEADSGYDANCRERFLSMAKQAAAMLVEAGVVQTGKLPTFDPKNRLILTLEVLPPADEADAAETEPALE